MRPDQTLKAAILLQCNTAFCIHCSSVGGKVAIQDKIHSAGQPKICRYVHIAKLVSCL